MTVFESIYFWLWTDFAAIGLIVLLNYDRIVEIVQMLKSK